MVGVVTMAKKRPEKPTEVAEEREYSTFRCYWEHGELLNQLAKAGGCKNVAAAIAKYLEKPIRDELKRIYSEKAKEFS